jgi:hypothetical protein
MGRVVTVGVVALTWLGLGVLPGSAFADTSSTTVSTTTTTTTTTTAAAPTAITLHASRTSFTGSRAIVLSGRVSPAPTTAVVDLIKIAYPYKTSTLVRSAHPTATGAFSFGVHPDRNVRYRVLVPGTSLKAEVAISVYARTKISVKALPLAQAKISIVIFHPRDLRWGGAHASWWFGDGYHGHLQQIPGTRTKRLSPYATLLSAVVSGPAGHFHWRVCFRAQNDRALSNRHRPLGCGGNGFYGGGYLPFGYPGPAAINRAARYLGSRAGRTAFAVVDSEGRISGVHEHWTFVSASVVKAMLLVAYLRRLGAMGRQRVDSYSNSFLYPMINVSDNSAATQTWSIVGDGALYRLAHEAGMTDFSIVGIWANAQISAADQAKFFFRMDSLIPRQFVGYARYLLSSIAGYESWGIPAVARPRGYTVFFKGGWRGTGLGQLVHQVARLEGHGRRFSMAVMTDGDPSMGYGIGTIQGVTGSLL